MGKFLKIAKFSFLITLLILNSSALELEVNDKIVIDHKEDLSNTYDLKEDDCDGSGERYNYTDQFQKKGSLSGVELNVLEKVVEDDYELNNNGEYTLSVYCENNHSNYDSENITFQKANMQFEMPEKLYTGKPQIENFNLKFDDYYLFNDIPNVADQNYVNLLLDIKGEKTEVKEINKLGSEKIEFKPFENIKKPIEEKITAKLVLSNDGEQTQIKNSTEEKVLISPVRFAYDSVYVGENGGFSKVSSSQLRNSEIRFDAYEYTENGQKELKGLDPSEFVLKSADEKIRLDLGMTGSQSNTYRFTVESYPKMPIGKEKKFILEYKKGDGIEIGSFTVVKQARLKGEIIDKNGENVKASSRTLGGTDYREISINGGSFDEFFNSDELDNKLYFEFENSNITLDDFKVGGQEEKDIIYEEDNSIKPYEKSIEDVNPLTVIGFKTSYQFDPSESEIGMTYNDSSIKDEEIKGYECSHIDIESLTCKTEWEEKDLNHDEFENRITFKNLKTIEDGTEGLRSGYMAGVEYEPPSLLLESFTLNKDNVNIEDTLTAEGKIKSRENEKYIEDANITLEIKKENSNVSNKIGLESGSDTNSNGLFSFTPFDVPNEPGIYKVNLIADKKYFKNLNKTVKEEMKINVKKSLEMSGDTRLNAEKGSRRSFSFKIKNSGQVNIKDVLLEIEGIKEDYYTLSKETIENFSPDQEESITISLLLADELCGDECGIENFKIIASGTSGEEKITEELEYQVKIDQPEDSSDQEEEDNKSEDVVNEKKESNNPRGESEDEKIPSSLNEITGNFMKNDSRVLMTISSLGVLIIIGAAVAKKIKKREKDRDSKQIGKDQSSESKRFSEVHNLKSIVSKEQGKIKAEQTEENKEKNKNGTGVKCPECGKKYDTSTALELHLGSSH